MTIENKKTEQRAGRMTLDSALEIFTFLESGTGEEYSHEISEYNKYIIIRQLCKNTKQPKEIIYKTLEYIMDHEYPESAFYFARDIGLSAEEIREKCLFPLYGKFTWDFIGDLAFGSNLKDEARECYLRAIEEWESGKTPRTTSIAIRGDETGRNGKRFLRLPGIYKAIELGFVEKLLPLHEQLYEPESKYGFNDLHLAKLARAAGDSEKAKKYYTLASERYYKDGNFLDAASLSIEAENLEKAKEIYTKEIKNMKTDSPNKNSQAGDIAKAVGFIEDASSFYLSSGNHWKEHKSFENAAEDIEKAGSLEEAKGLYFRAFEGYMDRAFHRYINNPFGKEDMEGDLENALGIAKKLGLNEKAEQLVHILDLLNETNR